MSAQIDSLAALRRSIARLEGQGTATADGAGLRPLGHMAADVRLGGGIEPAAVHEVFPAAQADLPAASGFCLGLALRLAPKGVTVWIRQDLAALESGEIFGAGLVEWGVRPERVLLLTVAKPLDALKGAGEALACRAVGTVVVETHGDAKAFDLTASRKLALLAERSGVTALLLRGAAETAPSAARTRWRIAAAPSASTGRELGFPTLRAELLRSRKGVTGAFVMEWNGDAFSFREVPARSRPRLPAPAHRPVAQGPLREAG
jgi:protein ImuA